MKRISFILAFILFANLANAYDFEAGGFYYNITSLNELTVQLTCGETNGAEEWDKVPLNPYNGDITIPKSVEYSGRTFKVTSIDGLAFRASILGELTIPENILNASIEAESITKIVVEDSEIPLNEFSVSSVDEIFIGRNIDSYYGARISNVKTVSFGEKVTFIPRNTFESCSSLTEVTLPKSVISIEDFAFQYCQSLRQVSGTNVEIIKTGAFNNCVSLESFNFPNLKIIDNGDSQWGTYRWGVFQGCTNLKNIILPQGLCSIGTMAFMDCASLESVTIPASVMNIGQYIDRSSAFSNCPALNSITINSIKPFALGETTFDAQTYINATLHVPAEALETYKSTTVWKNFFNIVGDASSDDNVCSIMIDGCSADSWGGHVTIGDKEITNSNHVITSTKGEKITLKFFAHSDEYENYELGTVKVNDEDVTAKVVNNELTIEVSENTTIEIEWDYTEADPTLLTIKHADNGCIKMQVDEWETYKFYIEPAEGWSIHTVMLNEEDITSRVGADGELKLYELTENSVLSITFQSNSSTVRAVEQNNAKVYAKEGYISIANIGSGEPIQIYNEAGIQVVSTHATSETMNVPLDKGLYIVKLKDATIKVAM